MIKTGNSEKAAENLSFLLDAGLITDPDIQKRLKDSRHPKARERPTATNTGAAAAFRLTTK